MEMRKKWKILVRHINSRSQMFFKIVAFKNFAIFTGKHFC